tara:strand:- start:151 stop:3249 length:3099 start_codon:yes stop_codon:yes gene_type:complete
MAENRVEILVTANDTQMDRAFGRMGARMQNLGRQAGELGRSLAIPAAAMAALGAVALRSFASFEKEIVRAGAVSKATSGELVALENAAREMGRTTMFTATQSAEALSFLAMAGNDASTSIAALPAVLQLATAGSVDLADAADIITNVMAGMGLEVDELGRANDVLVTAFTSANTNLRQLGQAFKYAGPVAAAAGLSFEDTAAALATMGGAGIQATMAGTALRGSITRLLNPSKEAAGIMKSLGVNVLDADGNLVDIVEIIREFERVGLSAGDAMVIFGQRAGPGMLALISEGSSAVEKLRTEMERSEGTSRRVSDAMEATFGAQMLKLKSAIESVSIEIGKALVPNIIDIVESLKPALGAIENFIKVNPRWVKGIGIATVAMAALATGLVALSILMPGAIVAGKAFGLMYKGVVASGLKVATLSQWAFNAAVAANPVGLIIIGIIAAVTGVVAAFLIFRDKIPAVFDFVGKKVEEFVNFYIGRMNAIIDVIDAITPGTIKRIDEISVSWKGAGEAVERFADGTVEKLGAIKDGVLGLLPSFDRVKETIKDVGKSAAVLEREMDDWASTSKRRATEAAEVIEKEWTPSVEGLRFQIGQLGEQSREAFLHMEDAAAGAAASVDEVGLSYDDLIKKGSLVEQATKAMGATFVDVHDRELVAIGEVSDELLNLFNLFDRRLPDSVVLATVVPDDYSSNLRGYFLSLRTLREEYEEIGPRVEMFDRTLRGLHADVNQHSSSLRDYFSYLQRLREEYEWTGLGVSALQQVLSDRLFPALSETQEAFVLQKQAALGVKDQLGPLMEAYRVLEAEGLRTVIDAFHDQAITAEEFITISADVVSAIAEKTAALEAEKEASDALQRATKDMIDNQIEDFKRLNSFIIKTPEEEMAGLLGGPALTREERVRSQAEELLSTRNPGLIVAGASTLIGAFPDFVDLILELLRTGLQGIVAGVSSFAGGGVVPGPIGIPQLAVVHGGEVVSPPARPERQTRGGGVVNNITMQVMGDVVGIDDLDDHIRRVWTDTARRGGFDGLVEVR